MYGPAERALRRLLAHLMAPDAAGPEAAADESPLELVQYHGLGPLCCAAGATRFRASYAVSAAQALHRDEQLADLLAALAHRDIAAVLLKGISYGNTLYDDPALRPMDDIDLLIRPERVSAAVGVARERGYRVRHGDGAPVASPIHHAFTLVHEGWPGPLDLHHAFTGPFRNLLDMTSIWRRAHAAPDVPHARILDPVDEVLFHLLHLARSGFVVRAIGYVDAARLLRRLDRAQRRLLRDRARQYKVARSIDAALDVVQMLLRDEDRVSKRTEARWLPSANEILAGEETALYKHHARQALLADSPTYLWGYVRAHLQVVDSPRKFMAWTRRATSRRRRSHD